MKLLVFYQIHTYFSSQPVNQQLFFSVTSYNFLASSTALTFTYKVDNVVVRNTNPIAINLSVDYKDISVFLMQQFLLILKQHQVDPG